MPQHTSDFAEIGQGSTAAYERCLLHRASLANTDMEELKPDENKHSLQRT